MKILVVLDTTVQSEFVVRQVARMAANTWADITLLGIEPETSSDALPFTNADRANELHPLVRSLRSQRELFLSQFKADESPYAESSFSYEWVQLENGLWEDLKVCRGALKRLVTRIRPGNPTRSVVTEARQSPCDLIVLGSATAARGGDSRRLAKKVVKETDTSVLVVAKADPPRRIVACLDQDYVSQPSLELINQMVTLYQAELEIVGLTTSEGLPDDIDRKMSQILKYYAGNSVKALVSLVAQTSLEAFARDAARENLVALWMGKQSLLRRLIPPRGVDRLLEVADSSVLILR
jgi:nucleotide-binding universal stress UspA family protein